MKKCSYVVKKDNKTFDLLVVSNGLTFLVDTYKTQKKAVDKAVSLNYQPLIDLFLIKESEVGN